ncbi:hypothetical protein G3446_18100 [Thiorhodococcus minor]|uniref:Uncharacterized protein n=1 Tax=Thiorhodococcus minor TaxID=57489 RepID=A0A6M0K1Z4_9GAMM|nr:hypothetical protein [Thiorhodococcus minor]
MRDAPPDRPQDRPKIDCVFKALLGSESNRAFLVHFLNAILGPDLGAPITQVDILNTYNDRRRSSFRPVVSREGGQAQRL